MSNPEHELLAKVIKEYTDHDIDDYPSVVVCAQHLIASQSAEIDRLKATAKNFKEKIDESISILKAVRERFR